MLHRCRRSIRCLDWHDSAPQAAALHISCSYSAWSVSYELLPGRRRQGSDCQIVTTFILMLSWKPLLPLSLGEPSQAWLGQLPAIHEDRLAQSNMLIDTTVAISSESA